MKLLPRQNLRKINRTYVALAVFAVLVFAFYGNTLQNGFILDDRLTIEQNPFAHSLKYLPKVVTGCVWEGSSGTCEGAEHYRPVLSLSYLVTWQISQSPSVFHFLNLVYYFLVVTLVFFLGKTITNNWTFSFFAALLFLIHPIHTEVVNWISATSELTFAIFTLLTVMYYIRYRRGGPRTNLLLVILFYFLALLSKEVAIILPLMIVAVDWIFFQVSIKKFFTWPILKAYLLFAVAAILYLMMRFAVIGGKAFTGGKENFGGYETGERIYAFFNVFSLYLQNTLFPYPLIFLQQFSVEANILSIEFVSALLAILIFLALLLLFYVKRQKLLVFSFVWYFVFLLPVLILFWASGGNFLADRFLFIPSIGFSFAAAWALSYMWDSTHLFKRKRQRAKKKRNAIFASHLQKIIYAAELLVSYFQPRNRRRVLIGFLLLFFIIGSWLVVFPRNSLWRDEVTLLRATLSLNPEAYHLRDSLAAELRNRGDMEAAKKEYDELLELNPEYAGIDHVYNHLGNYYRESGEMEKAEEHFIKSIAAAKETNYRSYNNLGALYTEQGKQLQALTNFCKAIQIDPSAPEPQQNYNRIASLIQSVEDAQFVFLYQDVMFGGNFAQSGEETVQFKRKFCSYGSCFYTFSFQTEGDEILFPFLIMASAFPQEIIRIQQAEFNAATSEITIAIAEQFKDRLLTFNFPACSGTRYESQVSPI